MLDIDGSSKAKQDVAPRSKTPNPSISARAPRRSFSPFQYGNDTCQHTVAVIQAKHFSNDISGAVKMMARGRCNTDPCTRCFSCSRCILLAIYDGIVMALVRTDAST